MHFFIEQSFLFLRRESPYIMRFGCGDDVHLNDCGQDAKVGILFYSYLKCKRCEVRKVSWLQKGHFFWSSCSVVFNLSTQFQLRAIVFVSTRYPTGPHKTTKILTHNVLKYVRRFHPWTPGRFSIAPRNARTPGPSHGGSYTASRTPHPCPCAWRTETKSQHHREHHPPVSGHQHAPMKMTPRCLTRMLFVYVLAVLQFILKWD